MNLLVTGGTGFIGSELCRQLTRRGKHRVYCLTRKNTPIKKIKNLGIPLKDPGEALALAKQFRRLKINGVIHLAGYFVASHKTEDIAPLLESNISLGLRLADAAAQAGVPWFINTGTFWQRHDNQAGMPASLYAATKQAFEDILKFYQNSNALKVVTMELYDTYGPGDRRKKLFYWLDRAVATGETLAMSPGRQKMNLVHLEDVVGAYLRLIALIHSSSSRLESNYCIGLSRFLSLREVVQIYSQARGKKIKVQWGGRPYRDEEFMNPKHAYPVVPGWKPKYVSLKHGLAAIFKEQ